MIMYSKVTTTQYPSRLFESNGNLSKMQMNNREIYSFQRNYWANVSMMKFTTLETATETSLVPNWSWNKRRNWPCTLVTKKHWSDTFITTVKTILLNCSTCWLVFQKNLLDLGYLFPRINKFNHSYNQIHIQFSIHLQIMSDFAHLLVSMSLSIVSMTSKSAVCLNAMAIKQINIKTVPLMEWILSICPIKLLATSKR